MSTIENFYTTTFSVLRQVYTGYKSSLVLQGTFAGHIQQAGQDVVEFQGINWALAFNIWCADDEDVLVGDKITDGTNAYTVKAISNFGFVGLNKHLEILVEKVLDEPVSV
jgi:hypothetical protein